MQKLAVDPTKETAVDGVIVCSSFLPFTMRGLYLTWIIDVRCGHVSSVDRWSLGRSDVGHFWAEAFGGTLWSCPHFLSARRVACLEEGCTFSWVPPGEKTWSRSRATPPCNVTREKPLCNECLRPCGRSSCSITSTSWWLRRGSGVS